MDTLEQKSVLISGGAGFVGSNLTRRLLASGAASIHIVDNLLSAESSNVPTSSAVRFSETSVADTDFLSDLEDEYDYVFHLATYHGNQSSIHNPLADHENNLLPTLRLLERLKNFQRIRKIVYAGAGCAVAPKTFGEADATPEDAPISVEMDSPYSISKIVGEFYSVYYANRHNLPTVRARFQNVYGPGEILGAGQWRGTPATVWRNVTPTFIYKAINGKALALDDTGQATRDFIFVDDIVRGLICCALHGTEGDVYNLASGIQTSIAELANIINEVTGNTAGVEHRPRRDWDRSGKRFGNPEKARRELDFEAETMLRDGIQTTVDWTRDQMPLIESCIARHSSHIEELD